MLASVDRVKAIEGIHAMNSLRYVIPAFFWLHRNKGRMEGVVRLRR
jgi:hypothetical protein